MSITSTPRLSTPSIKAAGHLRAAGPHVAANHERAGAAVEVEHLDARRHRWRTPQRRPTPGSGPSVIPRMSLALKIPRLIIE